jgi:hypothetical protein
VRVENHKVKKRKLSSADESENEEFEEINASDSSSDNDEKKKKSKHSKKSKRKEKHRKRKEAKRLAKQNEQSISEENVHPDRAGEKNAERVTGDNHMATESNDIAGPKALQQSDLNEKGKQSPEDASANNRTSG